MATRTSLLAKLMIAGFIIHSAAIWFIIFYERAFQLAGFVFAIVPLALAALLLYRSGWVLVVVTIAAVLMVFQGIFSPIEVARLTQTADLVEFVVGALDVLGLVVAALAGVVAVAMLYRRSATGEARRVSH
jgi:hypothetical protein